MRCRSSSDDYLASVMKAARATSVPALVCLTSHLEVMRIKKDWRPSRFKPKSRVRDQVTTRRHKAKITAPVRYPVVRHGPLRIANRLSSGEEISTKMSKDCCANTGHVRSEERRVGKEWKLGGTRC